MRQIRRTAARLGKARSHVVREAVADYAAWADRLGERERLRLLDVLEGLRRAKPTRPAKEVDTEIKSIRAARRGHGRRRRVS